MSSTSSAVTYTSVYTNSEPGRVFWGANEELSDGGSPRVIVYRYDGLPMLHVAPSLSSLEYSISYSDPHSSMTFDSEVTFSSLGAPGLVPVPSLKVAWMTIDLSRTLGEAPVPLLEPLVPGCLLVINIFPVKHSPKDVNPGFPQSVIACSFPKKTLIDYSSQSPPWLMHVVHIHAGMLM
nr:hypothetical protein [Tanacetum cinerariifolium]